MVCLRSLPGLLTGCCNGSFSSDTRISQRSRFCHTVGSAGRYHSSQDMCSQGFSTVGSACLFISQQGFGQLTAVESSAFSRSLLAPQGPRFSGWVLLIPGYLWEVKPHGPQADTASSSSLVIDGALIHFIILNTGEFCLPFFLCTVFGVLVCFFGFFFRV